MLNKYLYWEPRQIQPLISTLPNELMEVLQRRFKRLGPRFKETGTSWTVDSRDREYFAALCDAGIAGAGEVLDLLAKHEAINLYIE